MSRYDINACEEAIVDAALTSIGGVLKAGA
jgi:hypothetical protein